VSRTGSLLKSVIHVMHPFVHLVPTYPQNPEKSRDGRLTTLFLKVCCYAPVQSDAVECLRGLGQGGVTSLCVHWQLHNFLGRDHFEL
jgi:hypothetical protein